MKLIAFLQAQNCSNYVGSWRHPASTSDFLTPQYFQRIARTLEDARFDLAFFDDRLAMPEIYGDSADLAVENGIRAVKMDPTVVLMAMAMATTHLGLAATCSTTYYEPFHVARLFATMDQMTGGRMAWNVVTSLNDSEAANFGRSAHLGHDERYDRADEFLEIVKRMWTAWEPDAVLVDKASGRFADPAKVHPTSYDGKFLSSHGTFTVPRSPQGHPVLLQAGASGRGQAFAGRWADVVFAAYKNKEGGIKSYRALKQAIADAGRDPDQVAVCPAVGVVVAETEEAARAKAKLIRGLAKPQDGLALLCETLNVDFAGRPLDKPFTDSELADMSWQSLRDRVIELSGRTNPQRQRLRPVLRPRHRGRGLRLRRDPDAGRRPDGAVVRRGLRRLRARGLLYPRHVRGLRPDGRARAAASRAGPQGVRGDDPPRAPRPAAAGRRPLPAGMSTGLPTRLLTPIGMLGYGYPEADFWACVEAGVDVIVVDSGSTDPGPYMLGLGSQLVPDEGYTTNAGSASPAAPMSRPSTRA